MIKPGDIVRDRITGFEGVVHCRAEWLFGCVRISVQSTEMKDGAPRPMETFDEPSLEYVGPSNVSGSDEPPPTGGPRNDASRRVDASR